MAVKSILTSQTDFTGEIPATEKTSALWRFNESTPDSNTRLADSSANGRHFTVSGWSGTTASLPNGRFGRYFRMNINNPTTEKTHLVATNDGTFFSDLGEKITVGGWINPTTYSVGQNYIPLFNTRQGPGQPIFYISLYQGRPRMMLYNSSGTLILDQTETPGFNMVNGGWYFLSAIINVTEKTSQIVLCNRADGEVWTAPLRTFTGTLNPSCIADIVMGMHANQYYYAGGLDEWFFETDSNLAIDDLIHYFRQAMLANGGDTSGDVDALTEPGVVTLRKGTVINRESDKALADIDKRLEELQMELLKLATSNAEYDKVGDEIHRLRDQKQKMQLESANRDELKKRMADMSTFLKKQSTALTEYDEQLVRRLIEKVTIYEDKFTVEFKSGVTVDVE